mmetsp:Transcript_1018/g.782  ORF Transcript_1018/g.782 Transcript_1018/m.782 type:complete len:155 (+) Transcript_1018:64-528(+)
MVKNEIPEQVWEMMKKHLGYTEEEIAIFKKNPRNAKVMNTAPSMREKTIVFEVVESHGCNSQHNIGTHFFFTGDGNLITKMAPSRICAYAMPIMSSLIFGIQELWYAGINPNKLCFKRARCFDVGVRCGGWGNIILEAKVMKREEAKKLYEQSK